MPQYTNRPRKPTGGAPISSSTTLSFTSQLSSLINTSSTAPATSKRKHEPKPSRPDIFTAHAATNKKSKHTQPSKPTSSNTQTHSTTTPALEPSTWQRSQLKMEEKARLYAAMKRGDLDDTDERYAVDFDRKWAETQHMHNSDSCSSSSSPPSDAGSNNGDEDGDKEPMTYLDEFGRTVHGTRASAAAEARRQRAQAELEGDRFRARPEAPANVLYGDTVQSAAFDPDAATYEAMAALAAKRDRGPTPPPEGHFDSRAEVRRKGTGFYAFSADHGVRRAEMEGLKAEREETVRRRGEGGDRGRGLGKGVAERRRAVEERRKELMERRGKRKADAFLEGLGREMEGRGQGGGAAGGNESGDGVGGGDPDDSDGAGVGLKDDKGTELTRNIEAAVAREKDDPAENER